VPYHRATCYRVYPAARLAQSNIVTIAAGAPGQWVTFTGPAIALDPGAYWVVIHTGPTNGLIRKRSDGVANWYSNLDTFSDGAASPFGAGTTGTATLSVYATYTVGY